MDTLFRLPVTAAESGQPATATAPPVPNMALLDFFFPGFSSLSAIVSKYLGVDLNVYIPLALLCGGMTFLWRYFSDYLWTLTQDHLMSTVEIRTDDEIYNIIMAWVAAQKFAQSSRRFVVNTNLSSRCWFVWKWDDGEDNDDDAEDLSADKQRKTLSYTPSFGTHTFWYRGRLLLFRRSQNREQSAYMLVSQTEEISVSCFGRNPWILKELLLDAKIAYMKKDEKNTLIYRGTCKSGSTEPTWQRSLSRASRPFSTVILNEKKKTDLIDDVADYLNPATRRWYSNRGIPYRRGYLLYGPPGTGKSSMSLALAGHFNMRIYIVSLSSVTSNEENLATLFSELPRRCVVLLEDIDTAGLTHTRDEHLLQKNEDKEEDAAKPRTPAAAAQPATTTATTNPVGRLSLSGLLNILDGVASQEGRVLIMTTNHVEKLDKALIRPGRVDMMIEFGRADHEMSVAIFKAIFATLDADSPNQDPEPTEEKKAEIAAKKAEEVARVHAMAHEFASKIPEHEFSPAEIQGYLLKNKRAPANAVANAGEFVVEIRKQKKEAELKEAEKKRAEEKEREEAAAKKKKEEDEEKEKKEKEEKAAKKKSRSKKSKSEATFKKASKSKESKESSDSESELDDGSSTSDSSAPEPRTPVEATPIAQVTKVDGVEVEPDSDAVVIEAAA